MIYPNNQGVGSQLYWANWLPFTLRRAHRLVASSESTRRDLERLLGISPKKIEVVPLAASSIFRPVSDRGVIEMTKQKFGISQPYFINVGTIEPRKNVLALVQAFRRDLGKAKASYELVIVGKEGRASRSLHQYIQEHHLEKSVKVLGYIQEHDLVALYNGALGFANVSLYEGFGLPVLEAMKCGISGICSNRSSLPEVLGDAGLLVNPENEDEIAEALRVFASDDKLRDQLKKRALDRSQQFTTQAMADKMIHIFKRVNIGN